MERMNRPIDMKRIYTLDLHQKITNEDLSCFLSLTDFSIIHRGESSDNGGTV